MENSSRSHAPSFIRYFVMGVVLAAILVLGSGHPDWFRAWIYVGIGVGVQFIAGIALLRTNPDLLTERSKLRKDTKPWDKWLAPFVAIIGPLALWCVAAWDVRAHWPPPIPVAWSAAAFALCAASALWTLWAMVTNRFFATTVRIQKERGHVVIDGGTYRHMRHPGYTGALVYTLASPVALGSWAALVPALLTAAILVVRTALEDRTLRGELEGYREYAGRVRYRLAPGLW
jgi:protein-S-isoprenylcysteine O-methyltransferase Ste14